MYQGLQNLGNTCSINTLVQCIGHSRHLRGWLLSEEARAPAQDDRRGQQGQLQVSTELAKIVHEMWVEHRSPTPYHFLKAVFKSLGGMLVPGDQHDLLELWTLVVDKINDEVGTRWVVPDIDGERENVEAFAASWERHNCKCMSRWLQNVQGWTSIAVRCDGCGESTVYFEPFVCLGLDMNSDDTNMEQMFKTMYRVERVESRECDWCKGICSATKKTKVCMYPRVLVLYFKRFDVMPNGRTNKLTNEVNIPMNIRFSSYDTSIYTLCAIGNHIGTMDGGHYFAVARGSDGGDCGNRDNKWYLFDDSSVVKLDDVSEVLKNNREAYMLVYELGSD